MKFIPKKLNKNALYLSWLLLVAVISIGAGRFAHPGTVMIPPAAAVSPGGSSPYYYPTRFAPLGNGRGSAPSHAPGSTPTPPPLTSSQLYQLIDEHPETIKQLIFINGKSQVIVERKDGSSMTVDVPDDGGKIELRHKAIAAKIFWSVRADEPTPAWFSILITMGIFMLLMLVMRIINNRRQAKAQGPGAMQADAAGGPQPGPQASNKPGARKSTAKDANNSKVRPAYFNEIAGCDEAVAEVRDLAEGNASPAANALFKAKLPSGTLLIGPPGTGKTLLARALATAMGVGFKYRSGSDFVEMFVGVGASRIRDDVTEARELASKTGKPVIYFLDEIDAVGGVRGGSANRNEEREQTLNQLLVEMDGVEDNSGVIFIAATNRVDILDPALLRPGRFTNHIDVGLPDKAGRKQLWSIKLNGRQLADDVTMDKLAHSSWQFSGAMIEGACDRAATLAARRFTAAAKAIFTGVLANIGALFQSSGKAEEDSGRRNALKDELAKVREFAIGNTDPVVRSEFLATALDSVLKHLTPAEPEESSPKRVLKSQLARVQTMLHRGHEEAELAAAVNRKRVAAAEIAAMIEQIDALPRVITINDLDEGTSFIELGAAKPSKQKNIREKDKKETSIHEGGHGCTSAILEVVFKTIFGECDLAPVVKVTIMMRGRALGYVQYMPEHDSYGLTYQQALARIITGMAGRLAQEIFYGTCDTGASNDFQQVNDTARSMVTQWGMSRLGPISVGERQGAIFKGGRGGGAGADIGPELANKIDAEVAYIRDQCWKATQLIVTAERQRIEAVAKVLMDKETILADEFYGLIESIPSKVDLEEVKALLPRRTVEESPATA